MVEVKHEYSSNMTIKLFIKFTRKIMEENLDGVEFFAFIFLHSELLALVVVFVAVVFSLNSLSSFSSLPLLWVLCLTQWDHYALIKTGCSFYN